MSSSAPEPGPLASDGPPRWLLVMLAAGVSLVFATFVVLLLGIAGVERISQLVLILVLAGAALAGGGVVRLIAPRLPAIRRPRG